MGPKSHRLTQGKPAKLFGFAKFALLGQPRQGARESTSETKGSLGNGKTMKPVRNTLALMAIVLAGLATTYAQDALPSWNDSAPKKAIVAFVEKVTKEGSPDL